ncbi:MAG: V-type ATP synthase subunit E [Spirochaetota bacterium]
MPKQDDQSQSASLLTGITQEAEDEVKRITQETERQAQEIVEGGRRKADTIRHEAEEKGKQHYDDILKKNEQAIEAEQRKIRLRTEEYLFTKTLRRVKEKLRALTERSDYSSIIKGWIVEAAIGLSEERLTVNCSETEIVLITDDLLRQAEAEVKSRTGRTVKLERADAPPLQKQGIFLTARDGRLAFNNLVEARLERYLTVIRRMIYRRMQASESESE